MIYLKTAASVSAQITLEKGMLFFSEQEVYRNCI